MDSNFNSNDLKDIETQIWEILIQSTESANTPFHQGIFATINNNIPEQRTVILRNVDATKRTLSFNTDIRSLKVEELKINDSASWLFYDKILKAQLRLYSKAVIHKNDTVSETAWELSRLSSKMCYTTQEKPGSFIANPEFVEVNRTDAEPELLDFAHDNFAVIETIVYAIDFVFLNRNGNKRAYFDYENKLFQWKGV
jgi:3-hydroxyisobutyrate dehydrogenase